MKLNIIRQSWLTALLTLTAITVAALVRRSLYIYTPELVVESQLPLLGFSVTDFQIAYPVAASVIIICIILFGGLYIGHLCAKNALYRINCFVAIPMFGVVACSMLLSEVSLPAFVTALVTIIAMKKLYHSCSTTYRFSDVFQGSALIGVLPFVYAPASVLLLLVPLAMVTMRRSMRETVVAFSALLFVSALVSYIWWGCGGEFTTPVMGVVEALLAPSGFSLFTGTSPLMLGLMCATLCVTLCSVIILIAERRSVPKRAHCLLLFNAGAFVVALSMFFLPSVTAGALAILAIPVSMLTPILLVTVSEKAADIIYTALILLCIVQMALCYSL